MRVTHTLSPIYDAASKILILGTMPSPKSREVGFYYGHPQNRFWRVMEALFDVSLKCPKDQAAFLHEKHIALYDVLEACDIKGASDQSIARVVPADLEPLLSQSQIKSIYTTGKKAYQLYERYQYPLTGLHAVSLPSTSPANCRMSLDMLCEAYRIILKDL